MPQSDDTDQLVDVFVDRHGILASEARERVTQPVGRRLIRSKVRTGDTDHPAAIGSPVGFVGPEPEYEEVAWPVERPHLDRSEEFYRVRL